MVFFIFYHQEAPVRELLDGGGFVEAREGLEGRCEVCCHEHILSEDLGERAVISAGEEELN